MSSPEQAAFKKAPDSAASASSTLSDQAQRLLEEKFLIKPISPGNLLPNLNIEENNTTGGTKLGGKGQQLTDSFSNDGSKKLPYDFSLDNKPGGKKPYFPELEITPEDRGGKKPYKPGLDGSTDGDIKKPTKPGFEIYPDKPVKPGMELNPDKPIKPGVELNPEKPAKPGMEMNPDKPLKPLKPDWVKPIPDPEGTGASISDMGPINDEITSGDGVNSADSSLQNEAADHEGQKKKYTEGEPIKGGSRYSDGNQTSDTMTDKNGAKLNQAEIDNLLQKLERLEAEAQRTGAPLDRTTYEALLKALKSSASGVAPDKSQR